MPPAPHLSNLPPDIVFSVFAHCHVAAVVASTCRYFHLLALEKSVWIRLVRDLQRRGILDTACCPDITALSVMQLIKLAVLGPETWSRGHVPEVSKQVALQPTAGFDKTRVGVAELLPSGRYVLLLKSMVLECWDVAEERALWTRSFAEGVELMSSLRFAAEEMNGGTSVIIMVCVCAHTDDDAEPQNYIEIIDLDLRKGTHDLLLTHLTDSDFRTRFWKPVICSPIACITTVSEKRANMHFIVNWETQSALYLKCRSAKYWQPSLVALIPGHIFVSLANRDQICLVSTDMLGAYWAPLNREQTIAVDDIPKLHTFEHSGNIAGMSSPLRRGSYRIYAFGPMYDGGHVARVRYKFAVDTGAGISAVPPPTQPVQLPLAKNLFSISYAGHCLVSDPPDQQFAIVPPAPGAAALRLQINARYGGTMVCCARKSVIIQYYR
ncbi:hypothetical protein GGX14DRAFT_426842 [Mycena pura]|uniref:F-box domain-containing protein n=1 Tax=Mycena pura TaxID=153505 RepID=A0AAD7E0T9_9AGAR|nr:hypothetical protein GGX14DRAFT_426842 [Mycena pura]